MTSKLRSATIRLAYANPEIRSHLLPLLKVASHLQVGDTVTVLAGTRVGMGKLKAAVKAVIDAKQVSDQGGTFYGVGWTDPRTGKQRHTWVASSQLA
jgi:hypothetical protein